MADRPKSRTAPAYGVAWVIGLTIVAAALMRLRSGVDAVFIGERGLVGLRRCWRVADPTISKPSRTACFCARKVHRDQRGLEFAHQREIAVCKIRRHQAAIDLPMLAVLCDSHATAPRLPFIT